MYSPVCDYSPHHISTAMNEGLTQTAPTAVRQSEPKPFTTCLPHNAAKKVFLGFAPSGSLREDRVCLQAVRASESFGKREMSKFSQKSGEPECHITLGPSCGLNRFLYHVCKKTGFAFVFLAVFVCSDEMAEGVMVMEVGAMLCLTGMISTDLSGSRLYTKASTH